MKRIEKYVQGDEFLLTYGDGVADVDVDELVRFHHSHGKVGTVTAVQPPGRYGAIRIEGPMAASFSERTTFS